MSKLRILFALTIVALNATWVYREGLDRAILARPKPGPTVRVPNVRPERVEAVKKVTVLISNEGFGAVGRGTGVLIDKDHVLTCAHLISSWEDDLWIYLYDGTMVRGKPADGSVKKDLAIIKLEKSVRLPFAPVFQPKTLPGEPMAIIGNALGAMKWYVSGGVVSGSYRFWLLTDAFQIGGNSGGPWINAKGEIIGLAAWGLSKGNGDRIQGVSGAINAATIEKYLYNYRHPPKTFLEFLKRMAEE